MSMKKTVFILVIILFCFSSFASDSYKLNVVSAEDMTVSEKLVTLQGNVEISFTTSDSSSNRERILKADKVIIDIESKYLDALGNVYMSEGKDSTFQGDALSLNWDTLGIVVFGGNSKSDRKNASGNNVNFYIVGDRISYAGKSNAVFFQNGIIGTREKNPYWSVSAKKIALAGSDIFFSNAVLKLGRVPIFWLPAFFYPGNRLSFNPAIGYSSSKGKFLNTTYEIYGSYPKLGSTVSSGSSEGAVATNVLSFLGSEDSENQIRSGWTYKPLDEAGELSKVQTWAFSTGSYFAVFADAWEKYGLSVGYDTKNYLLNKQLELSSIGLLAIRNGKFRYSMDFYGSYTFDKYKFKLTVPFLSDPDVRKDFLNRSTVFGLDSVFGVSQYLPSEYSSKDEFSMILEGSASFSFKNLSLKLSSLKASVNYEWDSSLQKFSISEATLPYLSISSSGTVFSVSGKSTSKEQKIILNNSVAQHFQEQYILLKESQSESQSELQSESESELESESKPESEEMISNLNLLTGNSVSTVKTVKTDASSFKLDYSISEVFDNQHEKDFKHVSVFNKIDASINANGNTAGNWLGFSQSINPVFSTTIKENSSETTGSFKLKNTTKLTIPVAGLSYNLSNYIFVSEKKAGAESLRRWGKWDDNDVSEHSLSISKKLGNFSLNLKYVLPPMEQKITPSVSFSENGFSVSSAITMSAAKGSFFKPSTVNASLSYKYKNLSTSVKGSYDFSKTDKKMGFSASENLSLTLFDSKLVLNQNMSVEEFFKIESIVLSATYGKNYIKYSMKDNTFSPDKLNLYFYYEIPAFYLWKNRIGFEGSFDTGFNYDFSNKYDASFYIDAKAVFAISRLIDLSFSVKSVNNSFYRYYTTTEGIEHFSFKKLFSDLKNSFDFAGTGRYQTGFNLDSYSISLVHYMEDWTLNLTSSSSIKTNSDGKKKFIPEFSFLLKWNAIPELKSENSWDKTDGWEK